jgi:hypothetical protein
MIAESQTRTPSFWSMNSTQAIFPDAAPPLASLARMMIGFVLTQGTKIANLRRDSARRS